MFLFVKGSDMSMVYYGIPIFLLTNKHEIDALVKVCMLLVSF